MITKQELIDSGYELVDEFRDDHVIFSKNSGCYFYLNTQIGEIAFFENQIYDIQGFKFPRPFTDIVSFNTFANLYL
jgi:hypothetical protein